MQYLNQKVRKIELTKPIRGLFASLKSGMVGFILLFTLILVFKLLFLFTDPTKSLNINFNDLLISSWGFIIFSFIVFVEKNRSNN